MLASHRTGNKSRRRSVVLLAAVTAVAGLSSAPLIARASARPGAVPLVLCGNPGPAPAASQHVIGVMLENRSYSKVIGNPSAPSQSALAGQCGSATAMFGATHTSAANYLAVSAGEYPPASPQGCGSVLACADPSGNLYSQLTAAGMQWRGYLEAMPTPCTPASRGTYKIGHNPILFYSDLT